MLQVQSPSTGIIPSNNAQLLWSYNAAGHTISTTTWAAISGGGAIGVTPAPAPIIGFYLNSYNTAGAGASYPSTAQMIEIGIDPAGGTSYTPLFSDYMVPHSNTWASYTFGSGFHYFPIRIPAGASIAARRPSSPTQSGNVLYFFRPVWAGNSAVPHWSGVYNETIGLTSGAPTTLTSGTSGSFGSWTSLGTSAKQNKYWIPRVAHTALTNVNALTFVEFAYGDGTNYVPICEMMTGIVYANNVLSQAYFPEQSYFKDVPAGSTIYARAATHTGSTEADYKVSIMGFGG